MNKFNTIYENFKKSEDNSNLIGKKVYHGSPGYPMEAKIKEINSEKNGIEIVLTDDSFYNLSKEEWEKFNKTGKWSTTKWHGNGHAMIVLATVYDREN